MKTLLIAALFALSASPAAAAVSCANGADCDAKWARATAWVSQTSFYKIRLATDLIITTEGPINDFGYSMKSAMTVNRVASGDGKSEITLSTACANMFGCAPTAAELQASFAEALDPVPTVGQTPPKRP